MRRECEGVTRFRVTIQEGTTTHRVTVSARYQEEALEQAIETLHLERERIDYANVIEQAV
jgi:hypothetical protein